MNETTIAGPAPRWSAPPAIAEPVDAKMPAPMIAPTPSAVRSHLPSTRPAVADERQVRLERELTRIAAGLAGQVAARVGGHRAPLQLHRRGPIHDQTDLRLTAAVRHGDRAQRQGGVNRRAGVRAARPA